MRSCSNTQSHPYFGVLFACALLIALTFNWHQETRAFIFPLLLPTNKGALSEGSEQSAQSGKQAFRDFDSADLAHQKTLLGTRKDHPSWDNLNNKQQKILAGLQEIWPFFSNAEKRRWLAMAKSATDNLPDFQQEKMVEKIAQWSKLSERQRLEMRSFYEDQKEEIDEKGMAAWLAFSQLSEEEKNTFKQQALGAANATPNARKKSRKTRLVKIPAAAQASQELPNLPKVTLQEVQLQTASQPLATSAEQTSQEGQKRIYRWGNIEITPPEPLPPIYRN